MEKKNFYEMKFVRPTMAKIMRFIPLLLLAMTFQSCITLTSGKKEITFTSTPSGARVYRVFDKNDIYMDGINDYYIGTTPFKYKVKGAPSAFLFYKEGYYPNVVPVKRKGRWAKYILGNLIFMPWGHIIDLNKIYTYKQKSFDVTLAEMPTSVASRPASSTPVLKMPEIFESSNARAEITPKYLLSSNRKPLSAKEVYKDYTNAVFMIYSGDGEGVAQGSGFVISDNGLAVSNYHNFKGMRVVGVKMFGQNTLYAINKQDILAYNETEDYIIFKLPSSILSSTMRTSFTYIPVAKSKPEIGDKVYTIGSPKGLENTFSSGEVSAFRKMPYTIQINAPIDHGSSGGALINVYGEAIGITSAGRDDSGANLNFAIDLVRVLKKYK